jgi:hypothetical protein
MPVVCDVWSHEFNGLEHIFNVHAKYGTNHVEKELAESSANDNSNKSQKILKSQDTVAFHIPQQSISYVFAAAAKKIEYHLFNFQKLQCITISNQGPPPKFFS